MSLFVRNAHDVDLVNLVAVLLLVVRVSKGIDDDVSSGDDYFILLSGLCCIIGLLLDLLQVLLVLQPYLLLLPHDFDCIAVFLVLLHYFLNCHHPHELLFLVDPLLLNIHFDVFVQFLDQSLVAVQPGIEITHKKLDDHLGDLLTVCNIHLFFLVVQAN